MNKGYDKLEEWERDVLIFRANPNDTRFLTHVVERIKLSSPELQEKIEDIVQGNMMEKDPMKYFEIIMRNKQGPYFLVVKSDEDPWFSV